MNNKLTIDSKRAVSIQRRGSYTAPSGRTVDFRTEQKSAEAGTSLLHLTDFPELLTLPSASTRYETRILVTPETSLQAIARLALECDGTDLLCLNFASAKNPGGGFLNGAQAQEESLARASGLYHCLLQQPEFYAFHRAQGDLLYSDHMILSPGVPVFADDNGRLLESPLLCGFLTSPAVNARMIERNTPEIRAQIRPTMKRRMERVLWLAASSGYKTLILGAWGCGVFGCDPVMVAELFAEALQGPFASCFEEVVFAVYDRSKAGATRTAFSDILRRNGKPEKPCLQPY
ncbi:MAG: TIGR02452 family protein [Armatimonas sp.]